MNEVSASLQNKHPADAKYISTSFIQVRKKCRSDREQMDADLPILFHVTSRRTASMVLGLAFDYVSTVTAQSTSQ